MQLGQWPVYFSLINITCIYTSVYFYWLFFVYIAGVYFSDSRNCPKSSFLLQHFFDFKTSCVSVAYCVHELLPDLSLPCP